MSIKKRFRTYSLKKAVRSVNQRVEYPGYGNLRSIVLVFDASKEVEEVLELVRKLEADGKEVQLQAYIPRKGKEITEKPEYPYFCKDDINWYGRPSAQVLKTLKDNQAEVYISLNRQQSSPLQFISALFSGIFTIGIRESGVKLFDLNLGIAEDTSMRQIVDEIYYYLQFINNSKS